MNEQVTKIIKYFIIGLSTVKRKTERKEMHLTRVEPQVKRFKNVAPFRSYFYVDSLQDWVVKKPRVHAASVNIRVMQHTTNN